MLNKTLKLKILFFIIVVLFMTGCGGGGAVVAPGQLATKSIEAREIEADFDTAYRAATHAFFALGFTIKHSDKAGGIIVGTKEKINFLNYYNYTEFGKKLVDIQNFRQHRKTYIVRKRVD